MPDTRRTVTLWLCAAAVAACGAGSGVDGVSVTVAPPEAQAAPAARLSFAATVSGAADLGVTWTVLEGSAGGTITQAGAYKAPTGTGTFHVVATSVADPTKSARAVVTVSNAGTSDLASQLAALSSKAIWFGHQSVGGNIMAGVQTLLDGNSGAEPSIVQSSSPSDMGPGIWAQDYNGNNEDPVGKIRAFDATLRGGVAARVNIAFMKFCWVDLNDVSYWTSGGSAQDLLSRYQSTLAALERDFPAVKFVHFTVPLAVATYADAALNPRREQYNALLRKTYGAGGNGEPLFDLALLESTRPDGSREYGSNGAPALVPDYCADGTGHLNAAGEDLVARALVAFLAGLQ